jgi:hypothetical protein
MPTRKQRRRRQKEQRHEYEIVYVDEEGREVEVEPEQTKPRDEYRNGKRGDKRPAQKGRGGRPIKEVQPPSWSRVVKRALLFGPLIFLAFSLINSGQPILSRLAVAVVYTAFFVPFMYLMDRAMYRAYLRRSGQAPTRTSPKKR